MKMTRSTKLGLQLVLWVAGILVRGSLSMYNENDKAALKAYDILRDEIGKIEI